MSTVSPRKNLSYNKDQQMALAEELRNGIGGIYRVTQDDPTSEITINATPGTVIQLTINAGSDAIVQIFTNEESSDIVPAEGE